MRKRIYIIEIIALLCIEICGCGEREVEKVMDSSFVSIEENNVDLMLDNDGEQQEKLFEGILKDIPKEEPWSYVITCEDVTETYHIEIKDSCGEMVQEIEYSSDVWCDTIDFEAMVHIEDVNNDQCEDIWLYLGSFGNAIVEHWACFIYDEQQQKYVLLEGFEELASPYIDQLGGIRTGSKCGWGVYVREIYEVEATELLLVERLIETNVEYEGKIWLYDEELYENGKLISKKEGVYSDEITSGYWTTALNDTEVQYRE